MSGNFIPVDTSEIATRLDILINQGKNSITNNRNFYINLAQTIITLSAVLIALFQENIKKILGKSKLKVEIRKTPPDCHQILLTNSATGQPVGYSLYSRIRIFNQSAKNTSINTEVFLSHFWKINKKGDKKEIKTFLPMNLQWSHTHETKTTIVPEFYRYCDFGSFRQHNGGVILKLDTIVQPNPVSGGIIPNIINPGNYEFEIVVSGENTKPQKKRYKLKFSNTWYSSEQHMLKKIMIKETS